MTRMGAVIYKFHRKSKSDIGGLEVFEFLLDWGKKCWTKEVVTCRLPVLTLSVSVTHLIH